MNTSLRIFMDFGPILELLEHEHIAGEEMTGAFLQEALADFSTDPVSAKSAILKLKASDTSGLALAAIGLLASTTERPRGLQYLGALLIAGDLLPRLLLDARALSPKVAARLACKVAVIHPLLDVRLVHLALAYVGPEVGEEQSATVLRALSLVEVISDCSRLASYLVQFLRHPNAKVRSKAALLLGRANFNLARIEDLLASTDDRLRANTVQSLWGLRSADVVRTLWKATEDESGRVVVNALLGLCKAGERNAYGRLAKLAENDNPMLRSGAAWAMGEIGDPEFGETLKKLGKDEDARVRAMADKSYEKLLISDPDVPPKPAKTPAGSTRVQPYTPAKPTRHVTYERIG